ncbi:MAG: SCO family protein [Ignavibacteriales bacterium]|nr:SCO family protein [Ignavibacteriales bacterium]
MKLFRNNISWIAAVIISFLSYNLYAEGKIKIGIDEQLGNHIPLDLTFQTSDGKTVALRDIINKPTILALVYYECPGLCSPMQSELAWTIDKIQLEPGKDFQVISLSFDPHETPEIAAKWKRSYLQTIKRNFNPNDWIFLTGDSTSIKKVTDVCGFYYKPTNKDFTHATTLISISPDGKICRYLFGIDFNPFDMKMALLEAGSGKENPTISKVLRLCFSYDPSGEKYTLNVTRISGAVTIVGVGIFLAVMLLKKKKVKNEGAKING